jgi:dTDP-4-dehydrorhamnose reductase
VRALVAGAEGQLGRELCSRLGDELAWAGGRDALDVTNEPAVLALVARVRPDVIFNASAWNRVDAAETEPARAFAVNALAPRTLARAAGQAGARLVHVSTDYVFDGTRHRPYREEDAPGPLSVYGASKLEGENHVLAARPEHLVVRTSGVLGRGGSAQKGGSFLDRILDQARAGQPLRVVADQVFAPTFAYELAEALIALARSPAAGLLHVTNEGSCSWHELALAALGAAGLDAPVAAITASELKLAARRPAYSVLDTSRYRALGLTRPRRWQEVLHELVSAERGP